jgi:hypothetical protein
VVHPAPSAKQPRPAFADIALRSLPGTIAGAAGRQWWPARRDRPHVKNSRAQVIGWLVAGEFGRVRSGVVPMSDRQLPDQFGDIWCDRFRLFRQQGAPVKLSSPVSGNGSARPAGPAGPAAAVQVPLFHPLLPPAAIPRALVPARDFVRHFIRQHGVATGSQLRPIRTFGSHRCRGSFPSADRFARRQPSPPPHLRKSDADVYYVCGVLEMALTAACRHG